MRNIAAMDVMIWIKILVLVSYIFVGTYRMFARGENFRQVVREIYPDLYEKYFIFSFRNPYFYCPGIFQSIQELVRFPEIRKMQISYTLEYYAWIVGFVLIFIALSSF